MASYWLTEEFCKEHGKKGGAQLSEEFPDTNPSGWNNRKMKMRSLFGEDLVPKLDTRGRVNREAPEPVARPEKPDPTPYYLTEEFCRENGYLSATKLQAKFGESGWPTRRGKMAVAFPELVPRLDTTGRPIGGVAPEANPEAIVAPVQELTPEAAVEVDREVYRLREKVTRLQSKLDVAIQEGEVENRIVDAMQQIVPALAPVAAPSFAPRNGGQPETAVMIVSDYHLGEVVNEEHMGGLAVYNWDIALRRWQHHVDSVGGICFGKLTGYDIPRLAIPIIGDMVSGIIHEELVETAEGTVMEWVCEGAHVFAQGIRTLAAEFETVDVDCVIGNHGRLQKQVRYKNRYVSYDYLFYRFLALELKNQPNVTVRCNKSFFSLQEIPGATLLNLHGDNIKSWSGIPWYGINRAMTNLSLLLQAHKRSFDIVNLGHFHNAGTLDRIDSELVLNGSAVGGNEFSIGAMFTSGRPKQVLYGVHPERGKTWEFKLDLGHGDVHEHRFA